METVPARLITLTVSHFCEKARWALERARIPFVEERHMPLFHALPAYRAGRRRTLPVLVTEDEVYPDSTDILALADRVLSGALYHGEAAELEDRFDEQLGPHTRRFVYHHTLDDGPRVLKLSALGVPAVERVGATVAWPLIRRAMRRGMRIDEAGAERSLRRIERTFELVAERLADERPYLCGDRFSAADLAFAALAAPVVLPAGYGVPLPGIEELPPVFVEHVRRFRDTPAGRFALRMYEQERR